MSTILWRVWAQTVDASPSAVALRDSRTSEALSRSELHRSAEKLAAALTSSEGRPVAFVEPNGLAWMRAFLAIQKAGAVALPLDAGLPREGREAAARDFGAERLLDDDRLIVLDGPRSALPALGPDVCLLKLTSGSTGLPRAIPFSSAEMLADGRQVCAGMGIGAEDINFGAIPWGHSYGLGNLVLPLIAQGTSLAFSREDVPGALAEGILRTRATVFPSVPVVLRGFTESPAVSLEQLSSLRLVISAGGFLRTDVATGFYEKFCTLIHGFYGSTETGGICFDRHGQATASGRSVGTPLPGVRVEILPPGGGRVQVTSPAVTAPGNFLLADRGEWTPEGELRLLGRIGRVANVGGRKVDPDEVERVLKGLPDVTEAWVGVRTRPGGDDYLVAAVETPASGQTVRCLLATKLPRWQVPRRFLTQSRLPRNERGKLDRAELESLFP